MKEVEVEEEPYQMWSEWLVFCICLTTCLERVFIYLCKDYECVCWKSFTLLRWSSQRRFPSSTYQLTWTIFPSNKLISTVFLIWHAALFNGTEGLSWLGAGWHGELWARPPDPLTFNLWPLTQNPVNRRRYSFQFNFTTKFGSVFPWRHPHLWSKASTGCEANSQRVNTMCNYCRRGRVSKHNGC